ncbi:MAG: CvpA family protein [Balneolaceae bacterium]
MNLLDVAILFPIGYFAYRGFANGLIHEVLGIVGIVLAVYLTFEYMKPVSALFGAVFENPDHATMAAGLILFIGVIAIVQGVAHAMKKGLQIIKLNSINRIAGLCFGGLKAAVVVSALLLLLTGLNLPGKETRDRSVTYPIVLQAAPAAFNVLAIAVPGSESFVETVAEAIDENNPLRTLPLFNE